MGVRTIVVMKNLLLEQFDWLIVQMRLLVGFNLTDEQLKVLFASDCCYCGEPPSNLSRKKRKLNYAVFKYNGIDRVDNDQGYSAGNVVPCCRTCNWMKQKMSPEGFITHCRRVVKFASKGEQHG